MPNVLITRANRYSLAVGSVQSVTDAQWLQLATDGAAILNDAAQPQTAAGSGSGGGSSTFAGLTDAATANLPALNAPTASALAGKVASLNGGDASRTIKPSRTAVRIAPSERVFKNATANGTFSWTSGNYINFAQVYDALADFDQVALIFANLSTANALTIAGASVAVGPNMTDPAGNSLTYTNVTFGGSASATIPATTRLMTGGGSYMPNFKVSDFVNIRSVARSDVTNGRPLLFIRHALQPTANTDEITHALYGLAGYYGTGQNYDTGGRVFLSASSVGATTKLTGAFGSSPSAGWYAPCIGFMYRSRSGRILTVMAVGDSITTIAGRSSGQSWPHKAADIVNAQTAASVQVKPTQPVEMVKWAVAGHDATAFTVMFKSLLADGIQAPVLIWPGYTPNNAVNLQPCYSADVDTLATCDSNGMFPIFWTGLPLGGSVTVPNNGTGQAYDLERLTLNTAMLSMDCALVDLSTPLSGTGNPVPMQAALTADLTHPNDAGDAIMATSMAAKITSIASLYYAAKTT